MPGRRMRGGSKRPAIAALVLLAACNPDAAEIESALTERGFGASESACMARELAGRLDERDWRMIAELAGDSMRTEDEWRDMTVGEISSKLARLNDTRLIATLMRAGMGCAILSEPRVASRTTL